jgi:hypothetical protein
MYQQKPSSIILEDAKILIRLTNHENMTCIKLVWIMMKTVLSNSDILYNVISIVVHFTEFYLYHVIQ